MKYISNTDTLIDWDLVIDEIKNKPGTTLRYNEQTFDKTLPGFEQLNIKWQQAGYRYNDESIEWTNYFPTSDFSAEVVDIFKDIVQAHPWMVWISKIRPGKMAPWHFDAHSRISELKDKNSVRYTCYIQNPSCGHVSIIEDHCIYRPVKGSIYQWPNHESYHCGMNGGYTDKYMFNYWGYK